MAVTAAIELVTGQIVKMNFSSWEAFGEWCELNHELYRGINANPEKGAENDTLRQDT